MFNFTFYIRLFEVHFTGTSPKIIINTFHIYARKQYIHIHMHEHACRRRKVLQCTSSLGHLTTFLTLSVANNAVICWVFLIRDITLPKKNFPEGAQNKVIKNIMSEIIG